MTIHRAATLRQEGLSLRTVLRLWLAGRRQARHEIIVSNSEGDLRRFYHAAETAGVKLVVRSQVLGVCPFRVRSAKWLQEYGESQWRFGGHYQLTVELQGTDLQRRAMLEYLGALRPLSAAALDRIAADVVPELAGNYITVGRVAG